MRLVRTQNPDVFLKIANYWRKYIEKINDDIQIEGDMTRMLGCFKQGSERMLMVAVDNKEICGFLVIEPTEYLGLYVLIASVVKVREVLAELKKLARKWGYNKIYFASFRSDRAWQRLLNTKTREKIMEIDIWEEYSEEAQDQQR